MNLTARLFNCAHCHRQVIICSHCDRGNIYCGVVCSKTVRRLSLRLSGKRYQSTYRGRVKHAARQQRYRSKSKKVTHQGSPDSPSHDPLMAQQEVLEPIVTIENTGIYCYRCGRLCSPFLRLDFLHRTPASPASGHNTIHGSSQREAQAP
jgi:hypothetical protein